MSGPRVVDAILEQARWAPSGDNRQTWRFEILDDSHFVVHAFDTRHDCVYDLDGSASQIGLGTLLETIRIAASKHGIRVDTMRRTEAPIEAPVVDVRLVDDPSILVDPLVPFVATRTVNRRALSRRALHVAERAALEAAIGPDFRLVWKEGPQRRSMASLLFSSARLRLTMPEAYTVHRDAIEWGARFSDDKVPEAAVGLDPMTARLMRWVMGSWDRVAFFNRFLAGTWIPRVQLDVLPALMCAGHFFLVAVRRCDEIDGYIDAGRAVQRLWLTAAQLGLQLQPELTPLIFARYVRTGVPFSKAEGMDAAAALIATRIEAELGDAALADTVFMGRVGAGAASTARSLRLPLERLMYVPASEPLDQKLRRTSK